MFLQNRTHHFFFRSCHQEATDFSVTIESKGDLEKTLCASCLPRRLTETWIQAVLECPFTAAHRLARTTAMCAPHRFQIQQCFLEISGWSAWYWRWSEMWSPSQQQRRFWWICVPNVAVNCVNCFQSNGIRKSVRRRRVSAPTMVAHLVQKWLPGYTFHAVLF